MDYKIVYTFYAKEDLKEIYEYISKVLHNEDAAKNLRDKIIDKISKLKNILLQALIYILWAQKQNTNI